MVTTLTAKTLGQRIRQLRTRKGLTQQDLAGEDYSKSYISAIEQGKTRPSLEALQRISSRLDVPAGLLLDPNAPGFAPFDPEAMPRRVRRRKGALGGMEGPAADLERIDFRLLEAEVLVNTGHPGKALEILQPLLADNANGVAGSGAPLLEPSQLQKAYFLIAEAALKTENATEALKYIPLGMELAGRLNNHEMVERMRNQMGVAHYLAGQPLSALELHRTCLEAIKAGTVRDPNFKLLVSNNIANDYVALHDMERANAVYASVIDMFDRLSNLDMQADVFWEMARNPREGGHAAARIMANKAIGIHEAINNILLVAQVENNYGMTLLREGDLQGAEQRLSHSLELCQTLRMDCDSVLAMISLARVKLERGELKPAAESAQHAVELGRTTLQDAEAEEGTAPRDGRSSYKQSLLVARRALAKALALAGEVATAQGHPKEADNLFDEAINLIETDGAGSTSGEIYQQYAQVLAGRGHHEKASKFYERAYRSLAGKA